MIEVKNLEYTYPGTTVSAIRKINFSIDKSEIFGFLGPSGSGKSTTQKILIKLMRAYKGSAKIENRELSTWDESLYEKIGVGFELPNHYLKLTALENLNFFKSFYKKSLNPHELLEWVGLEKEAHKKVAEFSKGMKMRLNFIRACMHQPEILFLDEPTSGLDPLNARIIKNIIKELKNNGTTIFITTHQMHDADELCDRVAFIVDGEIKAMDSPEKLKLQNSSRLLEIGIKNKIEKIHFSLDNIGQNKEFITLLKNETIETMHSKESSLEDVFIKLTGKSLSE